MCLLATGFMALLDPFEGVVDGTLFPGVARGSLRTADTGPYIARVSLRPGR